MPVPPTQTKPEWKHFGFGGLFIVVLCFAIYSPALRGDFLWDDDVMLTGNPLVHRADGLKSIWFNREQADYLPLTLTTFWLEWRLWKTNPLGYHVINVILHALAAVLLWRIAQRLKIPGPYFIALIFAVHPVCVASVAWIAERKNTLSMVFYLLSILCYLRFEEAAPKTPSHFSKVKWYAFSLTAFLLALLSKSSVVMLPLVLLGMAWWNGSAEKEKRRKGEKETISPAPLPLFSFSKLLPLAPFFALSLLFGLVTIWFQKSGIDKTISDDLLTRLASGGWAVWFYLLKAVLPIDLAMIYPRWQIAATSPLAWLPWLLWFGLFSAFWKFRKTWGRPLLFGFGYFFLMLLPVLGLFDMSYFAYARAADHLQHLAIIGIIAVFIGSATTLWPKNFLAGGVLVVLVLSVLSWKHAQIFASSEKLWSDNLKKNPKAWAAHNNLGNALAQQRNYTAAMEHFQTAINLKPNFADAYNNLGSAYSDLGKLEEATSHFRKSLEHHPNFAPAENNLAFALARLGRIDEAIPHYENALKINPDYAIAHNNYGLALVQQKKHDAAIAQYREALRINPAYVEAHQNRGSAFYELGKLDESIAAFQNAIALRPDDVDSHISLGAAFAMKKDFAKAALHFSEAARLQPNDPSAWSNLGNVLAQQGKHDEAVKNYFTSLRIDPNDPGTRSSLGNVLMTQGKPNDAVEQFTAAIQLQPSNPHLHLNCGLALLRLGENEKAASHFREALRLKPDYAEAQKQLELLAK